MLEDILRDGTATTNLLLINLNCQPPSLSQCPLFLGLMLSPSSGVHLPKSPHTSSIFLSINHTPSIPLGTPEDKEL